MMDENKVEEFHTSYTYKSHLHVPLKNRAVYQTEEGGRLSLFYSSISCRREMNKERESISVHPVWWRCALHSACGEHCYTVGGKN